MGACPDYEPLLIEKVGGFLSPENAARLAGHLERCPKCRDEEALFADAISFAHLEEEPNRIDCSLAGATLGSWNRFDRRRTRARAFGAGAVLVAGLAVAFWVHHAGSAHRAGSSAAGVEASLLSGSGASEAERIAPLLRAELRALESDPEVELAEPWASPEVVEPLDPEALETLFNPDVENNG